MARALLRMQRRQVAKGQSIRWKRDLRHLATEEVGTAQRQYRARSQAHEIGTVLESFLFWLSFIFFRVIRIISAAALEAFYKEADASGSLRRSSTLPRGMTIGQNRRTYRDPAVAEDEDSVLSQEDPPSGIKKQVPSDRQPSRTPSPQAAMQADQPQQLPVQAAREVHHVFVPTVAMPDPFRQGVPRFNGRNISRFIKDYEGMCRRYYVGEDRRLTCLPDYCEGLYAEAIQMMPEFEQDDWSRLVTKLRTEYRAEDYYRRMETRDFVEAFVRKSAEQPGNLRHYVQDFTTISAKAVAAGNLTEQERGRWFVQGLPIEYRRHTIERTGAVADVPSTLVFKRLKEAVELRMMAAEGAKRMDVLPEEDALNVQLVQELRQQRNEISRRRKGRLLDPVRPGIHGGALMQQQSPAIDQVAVQGPAPGHEDWQNSARAPFAPQDCRYPQDSQPPQGSRPPQDSRYPQDSTAFGRPQWDARGQQGTQGQGRRTCFGCGGSHRFTEYECQGLKDLIQQGFIHLSDRGRLVAGTRERPGPELPWLGNEGRLKGIKNWLRTYQGIDLDGQVYQKIEGQGQTQQRAPIVRTDFTAFHDGVVLQNSNEIWTNWEDCYQVRPTDSVTPSQQRPQTCSTLRDSRTTRTTVEQQQAPPQEKNIRSGDYIQIRSRPADKTAKARKGNESFNPWRRSWRRTLNQVSH